MTSVLPPSAIALRDGFAVEAAAIADASSYTPVPFGASPYRIDVGEKLPQSVDAVVPFDAVAVRADRTEIVAAITPGDGVLPAGGDTTPNVPLRRAGERLRAIDLAVIAAAGIADVKVHEPRIRIACGSFTKTPLIEAALGVLARVAAASGCSVIGDISTAGGRDDALAAADADAVIAVGGTGSGRHDSSVQTLAQHGSLGMHGIAISPGETAALGFINERPVLLVPGRLDAALSIWLLIGRYVVAKLAGGRVEDPVVTMPLKRKVTSTIGITEMIPVRCADGMAEPLASGYVSFASLTRSDGWIVVPADSEGFQVGTQVAVKPWP